MKQRKRRRRRDGKRQIGFPATPEEIARLDRIAKEYTSKLPAGGGGRVRRSDATRYAVNVGLDAIERELGLPPLEAPPATSSKRRIRPGARGK
jgi:hypothetical protein